MKPIIFLGNPVPQDHIDTTDRHNNYSVADNIAQNRLLDGLAKHFGKDGLQVITTLPSGKRCEVLLESGITAKAVRNINPNKPVYYISLIFTYTKELLKVLSLKKHGDPNGGTIIITSGPYIYVALPVFIAKLFYKLVWVPFLVGSVEVPEAPFPLILISRLSRWTMKKVDATITYVAQSSIDYSPGKPYVEVFYSINDDVLSIYRNYQPQKNSKFTICYTGALSAIYNLDVVLDVIKKTGDKYRWYIVGDGAFAPDFKALAYDPHYDVQFSGNVSNADAAKLQMDADLLLCLKGGKEADYSKYYQKYTASGKLSEYLASGTPCLAGDIPAFSEKIKRFMTCEKLQSADKILEDIEDIIDHYSDKKDLAQKGRKFAFETFHSEYQSKHVAEFLRLL